MHMICPYVPISASTKLTEFLYISCRKKLPHLSFSAPSLLAPGCICLSCPVYPPLLRTRYPNHIFKFGLLCSCYAIDITYNIWNSVSCVCSCRRPCFYINLHVVCELTCSNDFKDKKGVPKLMVGARGTSYVLTEFLYISGNVTVKSATVGLVYINLQP